MCARIVSLFLFFDSGFNSDKCVIQAGHLSSFFSTFVPLKERYDVVEPVFAIEVRFCFSYARTMTITAIIYLNIYDLCFAVFICFFHTDKKAAISLHKDNHYLLHF